MIYPDFHSTKRDSTVIGWFLVLDSRLSEEEIQNLIEGNNSENTRKATKNAVVTFLAYLNKKAKSFTSLVAHGAGAYPRFL